MIAKPVRIFANRHNLLGLRRFAKIRIRRSERGFTPKWSFATPSKAFSVAGIALVRFGPLVKHSLLAVAVIADLESEVGIGMAVVGVAPFVFLADPDKNFFIHPGLEGCGRFIETFEL